MKFYIVDCFAEEKYQGNQLLVLHSDCDISDEEQQKIAREINFSETSFILSEKKPNGGYDVRIWTPNVGEVPFAGHPTLGTAFIIHHKLEHASASEIRLNLKVGQIPVITTHNEMTMIQNPPEFRTIIDKKEIAEIYGIDPMEIIDDYPVQWVSTGLEAVIVPLKKRETLSKLKVNHEKFNAYIERHPECYCNHLFFVDMGNDTLAARCLMEDFVEDPATGSANGDLAGYLLHYNYFDNNEIQYKVYQGEDMGRKSVLNVHAAQENDRWTIEVGGRCFIVAEGDWK